MSGKQLLRITRLGSKLRTPQESFRPCLTAADGMNHTLGHCRQIEPPIEAVAEGAQVAISVLFEAKGHGSCR